MAPPQPQPRQHRQAEPTQRIVTLTITRDSTVYTTIIPLGSSPTTIPIQQSPISVPTSPTTTPTAALITPVGESSNRGTVAGALGVRISVIMWNGTIP
ncbi:hypothetical protein M7I_0149 [Glarea lozoyensis 74030]|uniref:Uncharacterized protein n=1 Tax=Glarea lozoyensis (strain ATCC 74030 / MF5533) TaxID=1104152 RepID=H0ECK7_GLAL7|nr:hypothetical protein M7I_0149 [Glarea lozoyensis 74030]